MLGVDARRLSGFDDRAILGRLVGVLVRYDLLEHPFGRAYARARYTRTGRKRSPEAFERRLAHEREGKRNREE
ncbi:hypothetical protein BRC86_06715 [Halobacteriales archaeon QS_3_64_16]|nr:MAG: hypothetical protein BRC86_06715 [Halobacteriales archaeon QS_3_64_16]